MVLCVQIINYLDAAYQNGFLAPNIQFDQTLKLMLNRIAQNDLLAAEAGFGGDSATTAPKFTSISVKLTEI